MTEQIGGSLTQLMSEGDELLDRWVNYAKEGNASTPELVARMFIEIEPAPNKTSICVLLAATAVQRLATDEGK